MWSSMKIPLISHFDELWIPGPRYRMFEVAWQLLMIIYQVLHLSMSTKQRWIFCRYNQVSSSQYSAMNYGQIKPAVRPRRVRVRCKIKSLEVDFLYFIIWMYNAIITIYKVQDLILKMYHNYMQQVSFVFYLLT